MSFIRSARVRRVSVFPAFGLGVARHRLRSVPILSSEAVASVETKLLSGQLQWSKAAAFRRSTEV